MQHSVEKLERPERVEQLKPDYVLDKLKVTNQVNVADIGAGSGVFTRAAAKKTKGTVYALEISDELLGVLKESKKNQHLENVSVVKVQGNKFDIPDESCAVALLITVLHELDNPELILTEIKRVLTSRGRLGIIEWRDEVTPMGPPLDHRISESRIREVLSDSGFKIVHQENLSDNFNFFVTNK